ncbi:MAG: hypothetical protein JWO82_4322 [Akkermansiaceae bacterium]|nr:hypothetical protein [Akkermansiaceae bacterium]
MNPSFPDTVEATEDRVDAFLRRGREYLGEQVATCEERISESPGKAVLIAVGVGYLARSLPLGAMLGVPVRLAAKLAPPLLLALGAAKAYEFIRGAGRGAGGEGETIEDLFTPRTGSDD